MFQQCDSCTTSDMNGDWGQVPIPIFFRTASVINSSTFLHIVAGVVFRFSETFAEIDNCLKVFTNNYAILSIFISEEQWLKSEFLAIGENDY